METVENKYITEHISCTQSKTEKKISKKKHP